MLRNAYRQVATSRWYPAAVLAVMLALVLIALALPPVHAQGIDLTEWEDDKPELLQGGNATTIKRGYGGRMPSSDPKVERQLQHFDKMLQNMDQQRALEKELERREAGRSYQQEWEQSRERMRRQSAAAAEAQRRQSAWRLQQMLQQQQAQAEAARRASERQAQENQRMSIAGVQAAEDYLNQARARQPQPQNPWATPSPFATQPADPIFVPYTPQP